MLAILGSTIMVIHAPKEEAVQDLQELGMMMMNPGFLIYAALALGLLLRFSQYFVLFRGNEKFPGNLGPHFFSFILKRRSKNLSGEISPISIARRFFPSQVPPPTRSKYA